MFLYFILGYLSGESLIFLKFAVYVSKEKREATRFGPTIAICPISVARSFFHCGSLILIEYSPNLIIKLFCIPWRSKLENTYNSLASAFCC